MAGMGIDVNESLWVIKMLLVAVSRLYLSQLVHVNMKKACIREMQAERTLGLLYRCLYFPVDKAPFRHTTKDVF